MIDKDDIRAAVGSGLISEAQAASLTALAHSRTGARQDLAAGDEPFELFKGFNEIFIVIGLLILATGWSAVTGLNIASSAVGYQGQVVMTAGITAALIWGLSEYFIRRRRMVAPAIALSIFWVGNAAVGLGAHFAQVKHGVADNGAKTCGDTGDQEDGENDPAFLEYLPQIGVVEQ